MREYSTPATVVVPTGTNLTDDVVRNAAEAPHVVQFSRPTPAGDWDDVTCAAFLADVESVARGLIAAGVQAGDRVALMSRTRYEWTLLDYAIWFAGAVTVPVYETSSAAQLAWILADSGARALVVEDDAHRARLEEARTSTEAAGLPELATERVWCLEDGAVAALAESGAGIGAEELEARRTGAGPEDPATIVYTSGTTGRPKGCVLTHHNLRAELTVALAELPELFETGGDDTGGDGTSGQEQASTLLFLPLAHVFARVIQVGCVVSRTRLGHSAEIAHLVPRLASFRPTFLLAVPRVFEKIFNRASQQATADGRGRLFDRAVEVAIAYSRAQDAGRVPVRVRAEHAVFSRLVYHRLRSTLGGHCRYAISGGAPLGERLGHFFRGAGITVLEGYGLTETTAALTVNAVGAHKVGTVGRPLPGAGVRVADDGELLVRGPQVFSEYWGDPDATAEALDADGWFHTGDVGEVDDEGFVRITGRKKEILVTAGGKNVAPAVLEDRVRASHLVSQCLVVGDGRPFIAALVTIDEEALPAWAEQHDKPTRVADLVDDPDLRAEIQAAVDEANKAVSKAEAIRRFTVLPHDWTEEAGQVTPSLKLKRAVVLREFRHEIDALYE